MAGHPAYDLVSEHVITELKATARRYRHRRSGADILSVACEDRNKVFGITFRTPPDDSTGVAHILEHSVLCGSRKYPVKEPFVELMKSSLNSFLNAMTYPDKTVYPVASTNLADFYNLVDVYLDAVLFPRITPEIFQQEGWHYAMSEPDGPLSIQGVVFNEMKGAYSSPNRIISKTAQQAIFPDVTYRVDSGGDPQAIPDLSYADFREFHRRYYHPGNARIFFYGDDDPARRLELLDEYLAQFDPLPVDSAIGLQRSFDEPVTVRHRYMPAVRDGERPQGVVTVNWLLGERRDLDERLELNLLNYLLMGNPAADLWKALIDSGLGEDLSGYGYYSDLRQGMFSAGLRGIRLADAPAVEALVLDTLHASAENGFAEDAVAAALNQIEFSLRENNSGSYPQGLLLMLRALSVWLHDGEPAAPLAFEAPLARLKERLAADPDRLVKRLRDSLIDNPHRATVILEPDPGLADAQAEEEAARLDQLHQQMGPDERRAVVEATRRLKEMQEKPDPPEALATIPSLTLADMERRNEIIPRRESAIGDSPVLHHPLFTAGVLYLDLAFDLSRVPQRLMPYVRLAGRILRESGTHRRERVALSRHIDRYTGGVWTSHIVMTPATGEGVGTWLLVRGKAMVDQAGALTDIIREILLEGRLDDRERVRHIVRDARSSFENGLTGAGHSLALRRLNAGWNAAGRLREATAGVDYLTFLRELEQRIDTGWDAVAADLETLRSAVFVRREALAGLTVTADDFPAATGALGDLFGALPAGGDAPAEVWAAGEARPLEALTVPAKVHYVAQGGDLYDTGYRFHGSALVIQNYLRTGYLWEQVRVKGGAYGAACRFNRHSGLWGYASYRDPHVERTLGVYAGAAAHLRTVAPDRTALERAIIGTIGDLDAYQLPDAQGYTSLMRYLRGVSDDELQRIREEVLATDIAHFREFAEALATLQASSRVVVVGPDSALGQLEGDVRGSAVVTRVL